MEVYYFTEVEHYRMDGRALFYGESYLLMSIFTMCFCLISPKILTIDTLMFAGGGVLEISKQARLKYEVHTSVHTKRKQKAEAEFMNVQSISVRFQTA